MAGGGLGCCCCTCAALADYIACDAITIPGFTRVGPWQNLSSGYEGNCCYQGFFTSDDCQTLEVCESCTCISCSESLQIGERLRGYNSLTANGCVREIIIYRHFYGTDEQWPTACGPFAWCKWVVLAKWRTYRTVKLFEVYRSCFDPPPWPSLCPFDCECPGCSTCAGTLDWWRIRTFDELPQGTVSFSATDILTECISRLKCVNTNIFGGIKFLSGQQCDTLNWNIECDCLLSETPCLSPSAEDPCFEMPSAWCANPPPTWSIVFGEPC